MPAGARQIIKGVETRASLIAAARRLFVEDGFFETGTQAIVREAEVTRGALYHHFTDKKDLFRAVVDVIAGEVVDSQIDLVESSGFGTGDAWADLEAGLISFLRAVAEDQELRRILFIDGPAVLGWAEWADVQTRIALGLMTEAVRDAIEAGTIASLPADTLASMLLGILNAGAILVTASTDPTRVLDEVAATTAALLRGLRTAE